MKLLGIAQLCLQFREFSLFNSIIELHQRLTFFDCITGDKTDSRNTPRGFRCHQHLAGGLQFPDSGQCPVQPGFLNRRQRNLYRRHNILSVRGIILPGGHYIGTGCTGQEHRGSRGTDHILFLHHCQPLQKAIKRH